jgi:pyruvate,water dikinase
MNLTLPLHKVNEPDRRRVGGKGFALAMMARESLTVPEAICITTEAYHQYMRSTGLRDNLVMVLYRKAFKDMRWEEIWDTALRIRNLFLKTAIPTDLRALLTLPIESAFAEKAVSVRSSAPGEDSSKTSFAGLHESYVNIRGTEAIFDHIRLVWASLWSDRALLYRQELGLDVDRSAMAVVVQEMISGERSGVVFGRSPVDESQAVVEAVYGLNQGLVDGTVEPDRWILRRNTGQILSHSPAQREKVLNAAPLGTRLEDLSPQLRKKAPLLEGEVSDVFQLAMRAEAFFKSPQDVEWTYRKKRLHALQSRPITTGATPDGDERLRYLSLHRSFDNLKELRTKIEKDLIPAMEAEAAILADIELTGFSDADLADEIERRMGIHQKWQDVYWRDCIPFAHGMRMFGQIYNDVVHPKDPFEFMDLLKGTRMVSIQRNEILEDLAGWLRKDPQLAECLRLKGLEDCDSAFREAFNDLSNTFGDLTWGETGFMQDPRQLVGFLLEMTDRPPTNGSKPLKDINSLEGNFLSLFEEAQKTYAKEILDLARASYRLRDDDNIYLGKIEGQMRNALSEGKRRIERVFGTDRGSPETQEIIKTLRNRRDKPPKSSPAPPGVPTQGLKENFHIKARQIVGQPAGPGIAFGKARVVLEPADLFAFKTGEILVCDAVDPNMTFVVPLAAGIVERRGGMLIHGAIIAREYGLPCVTGVAGAATSIKTGDTLTVDGYLGIVIIGKTRLEKNKAPDEITRNT